MHPDRQGLLSRFFSGLTEQTFQCRLGVADPPLVDYISDLLSRFLRSDTFHRVRDPQGRPLTEVALMMAEAEQRIGSAKREVHRHIGDYTLFWVGVYPESLRKKQNATTRDHLIDYCEQGKRAYWIASTIDTENETASSDILERLSQQFELCAYGLREIRAEWERRDDGDTAPAFLIQ